MTRVVIARFVVGALVAAAATGLEAQSPPARDPEGAARQYRIARRLAAEGSPDAAASLAKVFQLDPAGVLADDALVEQALLLPVAFWPEDLGRIPALDADRVEMLLGQVIESLPSGDRVDEARLLRAMVTLEPLPGRDPARARLDLLAVTSGAAEDRWRTAARYGIAWVDERVGERERARSAYQRLAIEDPETPAGLRARAGIARLLLRDGKPGRAAALLDEVVESGSDLGKGTSALRELAVRTLFRQEGIGGRWAGGTAVTTQSGLKGAGAAARLRDGGLLVADRSGGDVIEIGADGSAGGRVPLPEAAQALVEDPMGRRYAAAGERVYRLSSTGATTVAQLGEFGAVSAMAADGWGRLFLLDRKGDKLAVIEPGASSPSTLGGAGKGAPRLTGLAWDGARLLSLDTKSKWIVEVLADGTVRPAASVPCERPEAIAADPAGEVAVLDTKTDEVILLGPDGEVRDRLAIKGAGLERADLLVLGPDGSLDLLVEGSGLLARFP